jgi:hypothetical protein
MTEIYGVRVVTCLCVCYVCMYVCFIQDISHNMHPQTHTHIHTHTYTLTYLRPLQLNHDSVSHWVGKGVVITLLVARPPYAPIYTRRESKMLREAERRKQVEGVSSSNKCSSGHRKWKAWCQDIISLANLMFLPSDALM